MRGHPFFLVLEGIDGSGTTTQAQNLEEIFRARGFNVFRTHEPSPGPVGQYIRQMLTGRQEALDPLSMALLFTADRMDHLKRMIVPAIGRGDIVICDRYDLSSLIYQSETFAMPHVILPWLVDLNSRALRPDLTIVLDVSAEMAQARRMKRGQEAELFEVPELQVRLAACYRRAQDYVPKDQLVVMSGAGTPQSVEDDLLTLLELRYPWLKD